MLGWACGRGGGRFEVCVARLLWCWKVLRGLLMVKERGKGKSKDIPLRR